MEDVQQLLQISRENYQSHTDAIQREREALTKEREALVQERQLTRDLIASLDNQVESLLEATHALTTLKEILTRSNQVFPNLPTLEQNKPEHDEKAAE